MKKRYFDLLLNLYTKRVVMKLLNSLVQERGGDCVE